MHLDACPSGLGAIFDSQAYVLPLPHSWQDVNIAYTEMINILVALNFGISNGLALKSGFNVTIRQLSQC